ncbi:MAG: hypothetical protein AAEJ04_03640 [Planctomycetota bacterium]
MVRRVCLVVRSVATHLDEEGFEGQSSAREMIFEVEGRHGCG